MSSEGKFSDLVKCEKFIRRLEALGIFNLTEKTAEWITEEIRKRDSHFLDSDLEVKMKLCGKDYIGEMIDALTFLKINGNGFVITSDGSIWLNTNFCKNYKLKLLLFLRITYEYF